MRWISEEERDSCRLFQSGNRRIESFQVTDLQDAAGARGGFDQRVGRGEIRGNWFFDQNVDASLHQLATNLAMENRGGGDDRCIGFQTFD